MFTTENILLALFIFAARVVDVSLGTFRQTLVIRGKKGFAVCIAFFESLIWVTAVSRVLTNVSDPLTTLAFALGFAMGTFVGISIENLFKLGDQVVRIFSNDGEELAHLLREEGYRVTIFDGQGRNGLVKLLFVQVKRRNAKKVITAARTHDPKCYITIDDVRQASSVVTQKK